MEPRSEVLGMLRQTDHPILVFSSTNVFGGVLEEGDYVLFLSTLVSSHHPGQFRARRESLDPGPESTEDHCS
jgi:hypothetical protein